MDRPRILEIALYAVTVFLGAFLLFLIEPVFAKLILPSFGGTASVWATCLVFFQVTLLAGYLYAYGIVRYLRPAAQSALHLGLLACALFLLPPIPGSRWQTMLSGAPFAKLFLLLTAVLGLPFFLLAATGPLMQAWFARRWPAVEPYRLFAVSNAAAIVALLAYPLLIEPNVSTRTQDRAWSFAFAAFGGLCAILAWSNPRTGEAGAIRGARSDRTSLITWFALAAGGSMLLLSTTSQITQNVAAVPFLWILPLLVYLVTFVLAFETSNWYRGGFFLRLVVIAFVALGYMIYDIRLGDAIFVAIPVYLAALFAGCMFCHGELNARKPDKEHLTGFYTMIAAGGAAGAVLAGLLAPLILTGVYELPVSLLFVSAIALALKWRSGWSQRLLWATLSVTMAVIVGAQVRAYHRGTLEVTRNFYGLLRVVESSGVRRLFHGTIEHGSQFLDPSRRSQPTTYYGSPSGVGLALQSCCEGPRRVGVVGLGVGTLATYGHTGDIFRFYEIDPAIARLAHSYFTFLHDAAAQVEIEIGDARLTLENDSPQNFDVLVIDAFSGDAIPVHLLTQEAFRVYRRHLKPSGVLCLHVSNQFLDLAPVAAQAAASQGMRAVLIQSPQDDAKGLAAASWVLASCKSALFDRPEIASVARAIPSRKARLWTDDYNDLFETIRW